jgi:hypothetical protein
MLRPRYVAGVGAVGFGSVCLGLFSAAAGATPATDNAGGVGATNTGTINVVESHQGNCSSLQVVQTGNNAHIGNNNGNLNGNAVAVGIGSHTPVGAPDGVMGAPGGVKGTQGTNTSASTSNSGNGNGNGNGITQTAANCNTVNVVQQHVVKQQVVQQQVVQQHVVQQQQQVVTRAAVGALQQVQQVQQVQQAPVAAAVTTTAHFTG